MGEKTAQNFFDLYAEIRGTCTNAVYSCLTSQVFMPATGHAGYPLHCSETLAPFRMFSVWHLLVVYYSARVGLDMYLFM